MTDTLIEKSANDVQNDIDKTLQFQAVADKYRKTRDTAMALMQVQCATALAVPFDLLMKTFPFVSEIGWYQYTDYFNDGEDCEFNVDDPYLKVKNTGKVRKRKSWTGQDWVEITTKEGWEQQVHTAAKLGDVELLKKLSNKVPADIGDREDGKLSSGDDYRFENISADLLNRAFKCLDLIDFDKDKMLMMFGDHKHIRFFDGVLHVDVFTDHQ